MTVNICISKKKKKKKESQPTDPFFSRHVTVNTTFFLGLTKVILKNHDQVDGQCFWCEDSFCFNFFNCCKNPKNCDTTVIIDFKQCGFAKQ